MRCWSTSPGGRHRVVSPVFPVALSLLALSGACGRSPSGASDVPEAQFDTVDSESGRGDALSDVSTPSDLRHDAADLPCPDLDATELVELEVQGNDTATQPPKTTDVACGSFACCAIRDGNVWCWGGPDVPYSPALWWGLCINDWLTSGTPHRVEGLTGVQGVGVGDQVACAIDEQGEVLCWDLYQSAASLPPGSEIGPWVPIPVSGPSDVQHVAVGGEDRVCALEASGAVWCWGGFAGETWEPRVMELPADAVAVAVGYLHACAVLSSGEVWGWGSNDLGRLKFPEEIVNAPTPVPVPVPFPAQLVASFGYWTCVGIASGDVHCWTDEDSFHTGHPQGAPESPLVQLECGHACCARYMSGEVRCWKLTNIGFTASGYDWGVPVKHLSLGSRHGCALDDGGQILCLGRNEYGQLGQGHEGLSPVLVPTGEALGAGTLSFGTGPVASCAVSGGGEMRCWGLEQSGPYGSVAGAEPHLLPPPDDGSGWVSVAVRGSDDLSRPPRVCGITSAGHVLCDDFFLGNPVEWVVADLPGKAAAIAIAGGWWLQGMALLEDGIPAFWFAPAGSNAPPEQWELSAMEAVGDGYESVSCSGSLCCATAPDAGTICVGGVEGDVLLGGQKQVHAPSLGGVSVTVGADSVCVLTPDGAVRCSGFNWMCQLGAESDDVALPDSVEVPLPGKAVSLAGNDDQRCAVLADGGVHCWGELVGGLGIECHY